MADQPRLIFVNVAVADLDRAKAFFAELGFAFDPKFTDDACACMRVNDQAYVMLLQAKRFADFTVKPTVDATQATEAILCVSASSREEVDELADAALAAGGAPAQPPQDHGFMYGRSFADPDGHHWEVMWMSQEAVEAGPRDMAGTEA